MDTIGVQAIKTSIKSDRRGVINRINNTGNLAPRKYMHQKGLRIPHVFFIRFYAGTSETVIAFPA